MRIFIPLFASCFILATSIVAQNGNRILIDGSFQDWTDNSDLVSTYVDATGDGGLVDILQVQVANDADYLYLHFEVSAEIDLSDNSTIEAEMQLFLDSDNDPSTGLSINGIGAEYLLDFRDRRVIKYNSNSDYDIISFYDIGYAHLPTVTSEEFEIMLDRIFANQVVVGNTVSFYLKEDIGGDETEVITYTLGNDMDAFVPISMERPDMDHFRLMTYNTLQDGLLDNNQINPLVRKIVAMNPDILHLNEVYDTPSNYVKNLLEDELGGTWYVHKYNGENMVASRYPFLEIHEVYYGRLGAALIDLPDNETDKDLLAVVGHLSCCSQDFNRQEQVDALIEFLADAKSPGGSIELEEGTPILFSGDMNLVGNDDQYNTIIDGNIFNNFVFGPDTKPDWNDQNFVDYRPLQVMKPNGITWNTSYPDPGDYPPGRLDFVFYGSSALQPRNGFVLDTRDLSDDQLSEYTLLQSDSYFASDHLPLITDFSVKTATRTEQIGIWRLEVYPNPAHAMAQVNSSLDWDTVEIFDLSGQLIQLERMMDNEFDVSEMTAGMYLLRFQRGNQIGHAKLIVH